VEATFARVMEWGMLRYRDEVGFASNVSGHSAVGMSFLDFDSLSDPCWSFSTELKPFFQHTIEEVEDDARRIKFLAKHLTVAVKILEVREKVEHMIEDELRRGGIPGTNWLGASLNDKVSAIISPSAITDLQQHM